MNCPIDNAPLMRTNYEGVVEVDYCTTCHGVWLDKGELEKIQEVKVNDYSEELKLLPDYVGQSILLAKAKDRTINCPVCQEELERREYGYSSQIMIDSCIHGHGIWLDRGEVADLEKFYERSRMDAKELRKGFLKGLLGS